MHELTRRIKEKALELGYARVGIAPAARYPELLEELGQRDGYERWKGDTSPFPTMADPFSVMPEAKSIISLVWSYGAVDYPETLLRHVARTYLSPLLKQLTLRCGGVHLARCPRTVLPPS